MNRYKSIYETLSRDYKAWYSPSSNKLFKFDTNLLHSEKAEEYLRMSEEEALESGYVRITVMKGQIYIETEEKPDSRVYNSVMYRLKNITRPTQTARVIWQTYDKDYIFPDDTFYKTSEIDQAGIIK